MDIKNYLITKFRPKCIVKASEIASSYLKDNNLSPSTFLLPYADLKKEQIEFIYTEKPFYPKELAFEFFEFCDYVSLPDSDQMKKLKEVLLTFSPNLFEEKEGNKLMDLLNLKTPWFDKWKSVLMEMNAHYPYDYLDVPFAFFNLVSSTESIETIANQISDLKIPSQYSQVDTQHIPKILIIMHESNNNESDLERAKSIYNELKKRLKGIECRLIGINSCIHY